MPKFSPINVKILKLTINLTDSRLRKPNNYRVVAIHLMFNSQRAISIYLKLCDEPYTLQRDSKYLSENNSNSIKFFCKKSKKSALKQIETFIMPIFCVHFLAKIKQALTMLNQQEHE